MYPHLDSLFSVHGVEAGTRIGESEDCKGLDSHLLFQGPVLNTEGLKQELASRGRWIAHGRRCWRRGMAAEGVAHLQRQQLAPCYMNCCR